MKCPHLANSVKVSCKAIDKPYLPSLFELHEYCRTWDHKKCPFYLQEIVTTAKCGNEAIAFQQP